MTARAGAKEEIVPTEAQIALGKKLYESQICMTCHSIDGSMRVGPSLAELYGKQVTLTNGRTVTIDDAYIRRSLLDPSAEVVKGYMPTMPSYKGRLSDAEVDALIAFIKSLK